MSDILGLAETSPVECITVASRRLSGDLAEDERARWMRALGVALRGVDRPEESAATLRAAMRMAAEHGLVTESTEAAISLAASVAIVEGVDAGLGILDQVEGSVGGPTLAHLQCQRAGLSARAGRLREAIDLYARCEPVLRANGDERWLALLLANRGLVHMYIGDFAAAEHDLQHARELRSRQGHHSSVAKTSLNLGNVTLLRGKIPEALKMLEQAETWLEAAGRPPHIARMDRARGLMYAGLPGEALDLLRSVIPRLEQTGVAIDHAEALLEMATAASWARDWEAAESYAAAAAEMLVRQGRRHWSRRADLIAIEARLDGGRSVDPVSAGQVAIDLRRSGHQTLVNRAFLAAARAAMAIGDHTASLRWLDRASQTSRQETIASRAVAYLARGLTQTLLQPPRSPVRPLGHVLRLVDEYRSQFSATEAHIGVGRLADDAGRTGLDYLSRRGRPGQIFDWLERWTAASLRLEAGPAAPDPERDVLLDRLRGLERALATATREDRPTGRIVTEQVEIERKIRRASVTRQGSLARRSIVTHQVCKSRLADREMVTFFETGNGLAALRIRSSSTRRIELTELDLVLRERDRLLRHMRRAAMDSQSGYERSHRALMRLRALLVEPLRLRSANCIVVPTAGLLGLPWNAIVGDREVVVSPSATSWYRSDTTSPSRSNVLVVAGPGLAHAETEAAEVGSAYRSTTFLTGSNATVAAVKDALSHHGIAHLACHASFRADNPMFSSIRLVDGSLHLYELEDVAPFPRELVFSACDTAGGVVGPGGETIGLPTVLLRRQIRSILTTVGPLPDGTATVKFMRDMHGGLAGGATMARAVASAARRHRSSTSLPMVVMGG